MDWKTESKETGRITEYGWQIVERTFIDGSVVHILNKVVKGRTNGMIICNKKQLQKLKHFMEERKFE